MNNDYPIAYCEKAAGKITGVVTFDEIVRLITVDEGVGRWTDHARRLLANPPKSGAEFTYDDIKLNFLPQILPNALFTGDGSKTNGCAKDGSPWCMSEWDDLTDKQTHVLIGVLASMDIKPAIAALTLSGNGVWALWRVDPIEQQVFNARAIVRHCQSLADFTPNFDASSVLPCQGRTLCHSIPQFTNMMPGVVQVTAADRWVREKAQHATPKRCADSPSYRKVCFRNACDSIRKLVEGGRNRGINAVCFSLHKAIGTAKPDEMASVEKACSDIGITKDELASISGVKKLRGLV